MNWLNPFIDALNEEVVELNVLHFVSLLAVYAFRDDVEYPNAVFLVAWEDVNEFNWFTEELNDDVVLPNVVHFVSLLPVYVARVKFFVSCDAVYAFRLRIGDWFTFVMLLPSP